MDTINFVCNDLVTVAIHYTNKRTYGTSGLGVQRTVQ